MTGTGLLIGTVCVTILVWLALGVKRIGAISGGAPIGNRPGTALLLVDLQTVFWEKGPYDAPAKQRAKAAILREAAQARAQEIPIVAVRQEWSIPATKVLARLTMQGRAIEGSPGTELAPAFASLPDHVLIKRVQDAFETGALDAVLQKLDVGALRIVGLDVNYCVLKTALAAASRGYDVSVVTDATLAAGATDAAERQLAARGVHLI